MGIKECTCDEHWRWMEVLNHYIVHLIVILHGVLTKWNLSENFKKIKRHRSDTRHKQRDRNTEMVSMIKTKAGSEREGKRNRCREAPWKLDA